jgi:predicted secreted hydrolase
VADEWWYIVGHLRQGARTFGYETTVFKFDHIRPPGFSSPISLYRTDIAITDEQAHRFHHEIRYYFPQSASLSRKTLQVHVGRVLLQGSPQRMLLQAPFRDGSINLRLSSRRAPMYVGGRGYLSSPKGYTYYYSLTDLATGGSIRVGARTYHITGISWLDHQWGSWSWQAARGWEWMALQLNNGVQMSIFDFRGSTRRIMGASVLLANGKLRTIRNVGVTSTGSWRSPHSKALYPSGWIVRIPALHATFHVRPTVLDQEMLTPSQRQISYWEGSSTISGSFMGRPVSGLGYTELTGYARGMPQA